MAESQKYDQESRGQARRHTLEEDPAALERFEVAIAQIRKLGDPVLRTPANKVENFDHALQEQIARMVQIAEDGFGYGLAAPQLGISNRVLVYRIEAAGDYTPLINPEIEWSSNEVEVQDEACMSIPNVAVPVERNFAIHIRAHDESGNERVLEVEGIEARVLQHEIDHLNGILTLDRTSTEHRREAMSSLREESSFNYS